jgi:Undecaprenyl-phosphate galactose phosphotransferase WbaP
LSPVESLRRQVQLTCVVFGGVFTALFLSKTGLENSRFTLFLAFLLAIPLIPFIRMLGKRFLIRAKLWGIPVAIYGGGEAGQSIIRRLKDEPGEGYYPVCIFDDNPDLLDRTIEGIPVRGTTQSVALNVPMAILAMTRIEAERMTELMEGSLANYLKVVIIPNLIHVPWIWATTRDLNGTPGLEIANNLLDPRKRIFKRTIELGLTLVTLPLWAPLYCLIYLIIRSDGRGDPIFRQERIGQGACMFETLKFRTMVPHAEDVLKSKLSENPELREEWERNCKLRNDPRITRVGKFLRRTSLDEIPQLINVLRGEMSLVGPRPLPQYHYHQLPSYVLKLRERVKPGITGLWQVSGRSESGNDGMIRWDPYYVRNWSPWLDIVILVRTFRAVSKGTGAR